MGACEMGGAAAFGGGAPQYQSSGAVFDDCARFGMAVGAGELGDYTGTADKCQPTTRSIEIDDLPKGE